MKALPDLFELTPMFMAVLLVLSCGLVFVAFRLLRALRDRPDEPAFRANPLLNRPEAKLYRMIAHRLPKGYHLMAQVSYGEMLRCASAAKFLTVNTRRADIAITDRAFNVIAVFEYQGPGHYGRNVQSALRARRGDAAKRRALDEAGIPLIDIPKHFDATTVDAALAVIFPAEAPERPPVAIRRTTS